MFNPIPFIEAKRDGKSHSPDDLERFVRGYSAGEVADYQAAAWLMAVYFQGLDAEELRAFTLALAHSGDVVALPEGIRAVDKHSTGGVGDKTTLVLVPLVAACGVPVAKLSGRGLGFTGGTVDKLESIPGFESHLPLSRFKNQVAEIGCAVSGHSLDLAPAEGLFYSLRDVTATVPSLPLIASSIVGKKIAGGAGSFVFDVKCGSGAFMPDLERARELARALVDLSASLGRKSLALVTDMDQPLGTWVGNAAEVNEAFQVLSGSGPEDTAELCRKLGGAMLLLGGAVPDLETGRLYCARALQDGRALDRFLQMVAAQGGCVDSLRKGLPLASRIREIRSKAAGRISVLDARCIGDAVKWLGGGRIRKDDRIDHGVAVQLLAKKGDTVQEGQPLMRVYYGDSANAQEALGLLEKACSVGSSVGPAPLIMETIGFEGTVQD